MHRIEDDLKAALRRKPAPPGFAERILERIEEDKSLRRDFLRLRTGRRRLFAAAALVLMTIGAGVFGYRQYIRNRNETAYQNTLTAIYLATVELDRAKNIALEPERWERLSRQLAEYEVNNQK